MSGNSQIDVTWGNGQAKKLSKTTSIKRRIKKKERIIPCGRERIKGLKK